MTPEVDTKVDSRADRGWGAVGIGVAAGCGVAWLHGGLFVLDGRLGGYTWPAYLMNAWRVGQGHSAQVDLFRGPLHGALVSGLGDALNSYADAAVLVASVCVVAMIASAGLAGRALGGPVAGALAAATLPLVVDVSAAAHWATTYPLLAALSAIAVAGAVAAARWGSLGAGIAAGGALGLAVAADDRGLLMVPVVGALVVMGAWRAGWPRGLAGPLALALAVALAGPLNRALGLPDTIHTSHQSKRAVQRGVVHRWVHAGRDDVMKAACAPIGPDDVLTAGFLWTPCARAVLRHNLWVVGPVQAPFAPWWIVLGCLGWLLPGRPRARRVGLVVGATLGPVALLAWSITPMPPRYWLQWTTPLALVVPVAIGRVLHRLRGEPPPRSLQLAVAGVVFAGVWLADPHARRSPASLNLNAGHQRDAPLHAWLRARLDPADHLLDCADRSIHMAMLPAFVGPMGPQLRADDANRCLLWLARSPPQTGTRWVVLDPQRTLPHPDTRAPVDLREMAAQDAGWTQVDGFSGVELWAQVAAGD